jgi:alpha-tubulin suppressor-like RCC1 family protein
MRRRLTAPVPWAAAAAALALGALGCSVVADTPDAGRPGAVAAVRDAGGSSTGAAPDAASAGSAPDAAGATGSSSGGGDDASAGVIDVAVPSAGAATSVAAGSQHTCAIGTGGIVYCWGSNVNGQLGDGTTTDSWVPVAVSGLAPGVAAIAAGAFHTCALTSGANGGTVQCWGRNDHGQLGNGSNADSPLPVAVTGLGSNVTAIAAGGLHTCALGGSGVSCWGDNEHGQLGNGAMTDSPMPVMVTGVLPGAATIAAGGAHTCVSGGGVQCWGFDANGQLGNGSTTDSLLPVSVMAVASGVSAVSAGGAHTCALAYGGTLQCWGYGLYGQIGDDAIADCLMPTTVTVGTKGAVAVAAGGEHTCAIDGAGAAWCWGEDQSGQLGNDDSVNSRTPVPVTGITSGATAIAAGTAHACVLVGGSVQCWGWNVAGALGNGTNADSAVPVRVLGF